MVKRVEPHIHGEIVGPVVADETTRLVSGVEVDVVKVYDNGTVWVREVSARGHFIPGWGEYMVRTVPRDAGRRPAG